MQPAPLDEADSFAGFFGNHWRAALPRQHFLAIEQQLDLPAALGLRVLITQDLALGTILERRIERVGLLQPRRTQRNRDHTFSGIKPVRGKRKERDAIAAL